MGGMEVITPSFKVITAPVERRDGHICVPETAIPGDAAEIGASWVKGDCMTGAGIYDGDVVVFILQDCARNGDMVVANAGDGPMLGVFWRDDGATWLLYPGEYPSVPADGATIIARVVAVVHPRGGEDTVPIEGLPFGDGDGLW